MLVVIAALSSCKKDTTTDPSVNDLNSNSALPLKAASYIDDNYPDASVDYYMTVTNSPAAFLVTLTTDEELAFNQIGSFLGLGSQFQNGVKNDTIHCNPGGHGGIPIDSLPVSITDYVTANYAGYSIRNARYDSLCVEGLVIGVMLFQDGYEPVKLIFTTTGDFLLRADRMLYADMPQVVKDFITSNYADFTISDKAEKYTLTAGDLQYVVYLRQDSTKKSARVDALGALICEQSGTGHGGGGGHHGGGGHGGGGHHGGGHGGGGHHGGPGSIPIDSLPVAITDYISANYTGYTIREAHYDSICITGNAIKVMISQSDSTGLDLFFETSGNFVMRADKITYSEVPQLVKDYITANYTGYQPGKSDQLTLADGAIQYVIDLNKPHQRKKVTIDATGALVCEQ